MTRPILRIKHLHPDAVTPKYQSAGAACFDLHCVDGGFIECGQSVTFRIGISCEIPVGFALLIHSRSGHGFKHGVRLANGTGVVDSDFRGELEVRLRNDHGYLDFNVRDGDRIAQAMLIAAPQYEILEVSELTDTVRGTQGFGSTGA